MPKTLKTAAMALALVLPALAQDAGGAGDEGDPRVWEELNLPHTPMPEEVDLDEMAGEVAAAAAGGYDGPTLDEVMSGLASALMESFYTDDLAGALDALGDMDAALDGQGIVCRCCGAPLMADVDGFRFPAPKTSQRYVLATRYICTEWNCGFAERVMQVAYQWIGPDPEPIDLSAMLTPRSQSKSGTLQCAMHGMHLLFSGGTIYPPGVQDRQRMVTPEEYPALFQFATWDGAGVPGFRNGDTIVHYDGDVTTYYETGEVVPMVIGDDVGDDVADIRLHLVCANGHNQSDPCPDEVGEEYAPPCVNGYMTVAEVTGEPGNQTLTITKVPCGSGGGGGGGGTDDNGGRPGNQNKYD